MAFARYVTKWSQLSISERDKAPELPQGFLVAYKAAFN
jgi:hypothetical protein